jgi:hypothetical protein
LRAETSALADHVTHEARACAKVLGLEVPAGVSAMADEVIE